MLFELRALRAAVTSRGHGMLEVNPEAARILVPAAVIVIGLLEAVPTGQTGLLRHEIS
jgi:hypothetical protein